MAKPPEATPRRVVVGPDVVAKSFLDPGCRTVLELWRDGKIQLVITRDLLFAYFRLLRSLNIPDAQLRCWIRWFTARGRSVLFSESASSERDHHEILCDAACRGEANVIVSTRVMDPQTGEKVPTDENISWLTVNEFLAEYVGNERATR